MKDLSTISLAHAPSKLLSSDGLKRMIYTELSASGFRFRRNEIIPPNLQDKDALRRVHRPALDHMLQENKKWILQNEPKYLDFMADGSDIIPDEILPELVLVEDEFNSGLFRYASYLWSVPLSRGFGRRLRYLIMDKSNGKLIGIIGLTDPIIGLGVRDKWIGWDREQKEKMLWHVLDAYAFGAVPPYNKLLGGKLVATLATSDKVRNDFRRKYKENCSIISGISRKPELVLLTTTGAYGKSSILDRLRVQDRPLWEDVGFTEGWGLFHLNNGIATRIQAYLREINHPILKTYEFGNGPNWKMRVIKQSMKELGIDSEKYCKHGVKRGFYAAPLAKNFREFLNGEVKRPKYYKQSEKELFEYFKTRYLLPRAERVTDWKDWNHKTLELSSKF